jgi:hypothetical protein
MDDKVVVGVMDLQFNSSNSLKTTQIRCAFQKMIINHWQLRSILKNDVFELAGEFMKDLDYQINHFDTKKTKSQQELMEQELNIPFGKNKLGWRVSIYTDEPKIADGVFLVDVVLVFTIRKKFADESKLQLIMKSFIGCLQDVLDGNDYIPDIYELEDLPLYEQKFISLDPFKYVSSIWLMVQHILYYYQTKIRFASNYKPVIETPAKNSLRIVVFGQEHTAKIKTMTATKNIQINNFVQFCFLCAFKELSSKLCPIQQLEVTDTKHLMVYIIPTALLIVLCYEEGLDSLAWIPCLLIYYLFRVTTFRPKPKMERFNITNNLGLVEMTVFNFKLNCQNQFWRGVKVLEEKWYALGFFVGTYSMLCGLMPDFKQFEIFKWIGRKDIAAAFSHNGSLNVDDLVHENAFIRNILCSSSVAWEGNRAVFSISTQEIGGKLQIAFVYPTQLLSSYEIDEFILNFQQCVLKAIKYEHIDVSEL